MTLPEVLSVVPSERRQLDTTRTTEFLGLTAPGGVFDPVPGNNSDSETTLVEIPRLAIHAVQGAGLQSPVDGQLVEIEGMHGVGA